MKKFRLKGTSEDVHDDRLSDEQLIYLIQSFESFIRNMGSALSVTYELKDSSLSRKYDCSRFTLTIQKTTPNGVTYYQGTYKDGSKRLIIHATLEEV